MKEKEFIKTIKNILNSEYIGDDCAYLKDLGIVISQDSLVEDVHFSMKYTTPYQLGWKAVMVNISDICASGAEPKYLTIALSLPKHIENNFIEEFYKGAKEACNNIKIVGGDITGSDKIFISITAIGETNNRRISSRSNAKPKHLVIVSGEHGNSAKGLEILQKNKLENKFTKAHLMPVAQRDFSKQIATQANFDYAMMDTSDGLADALIQIAHSSSVKISVDTSMIPHDKEVDIEKTLFGGEDYQLVATVEKNLLKNLNNYTIIGKVEESTISGIEIDGVFYTNIDNKIYNHFEDKHELQN